MRSKALRWLALAGAILALAAFLVWRSPERASERDTKSVDPLAVIPPGAALVVTVDPARLTQGGARDALVRGGASVFGFGGGVCEVATLSRARSIALSVAGEEALHSKEPLQIAVIASGDFVAAEVASCAEQAVQKKAGEPVRAQIGSFLAVRDRRGSPGEVAVRDGGPLVIGAGRYLRDILDLSEGKKLRATPFESARDALHAELRRSFGRDAPVVGTLTLPSWWLESVTGDDEARLSPLAKIRGAALRVERAGSGYLAEAVLAHENVGASEEVEKLLVELLKVLDQDTRLPPRVRAQLVPRRDATNLYFSVHLTQGELDGLLPPPPAPAPSR